MEKGYTSIIFCWHEAFLVRASLKKSLHLYPHNKVGDLNEPSEGWRSPMGSHEGQVSFSAQEEKRQREPQGWRRRCLRNALKESDTSDRWGNWIGEKQVGVWLFCMYFFISCAALMYQSSGVRSLCKAWWNFWLLHICGALNGKSKSLQGLNTGKILGCQCPESTAVTPRVLPLSGAKGARAEDKGSEDRDLPSALKAGIDISIRFICKFSPADNSHFQGKGGCPTNADDRGTCRWRKGHGDLTPFGFCHPSLTALCLLPRRLGWLPVASDSIAFQIAAATLVFCFFFMREWSVRFAHSEPWRSWTARWTGLAPVTPHFSKAQASSASAPHPTPSQGSSFMNWNKNAMRFSSLLTLQFGLFPYPLHVFGWSLAAVFCRTEFEICDMDTFGWLEMGNTSLLWQRGEGAEKKSCTEQRERKETVSWQDYCLGCLNKIKEANETKAREKYWFSRGSLRIISKSETKYLLG